MKHKQFVIRWDEKIEHAFGKANHGWHAISLCKRKTSYEPYSSPGDGKRLCRHCCKILKEKGWV